VLFYTGLALCVVLVALIASVFLFKDKIINEFIREANKQLNTPVKIGKIDVSLFDQFPQISIVLNSVYVEDSHPGQYPLLTADRISFVMNPIEVYRGNYTIKGIKVENSETTLKLNAKGETNYDIVKKQTGSSKGSVGFALHDVSLVNTKVRYLDVKQSQDFVFNSTDMIASITSDNDVYEISAEGQLTSDKIQIGKNTFLDNKAFQIKSELTYDDNKKTIVIKPSSLDLKHAKFSVSGTYGWKNKNIVNIETKGKNTDIQTLISLLPQTLASKLVKYQSKGDVYFSSRIKGEISKTKNPEFVADFGCSNATIYHPDYKSKIENATVKGSFATSELGNARESALVLKNISGKLNNENFTGNFVIQDFVDPEVICDFKGKVDAPSVLSFYPIEELQNVSGTLLVDISFEGKIAFLKNKATAQRVATLGTIDLQNINLDYGREKIPLQNLNGNLQFSNNDLALSNVSGKLGNSDFLLNGFFKNVITFILFENQPIGIETDLKSRYVDLDQVFAITFGNPTEGVNQEYTFSISRNVNLNFNCDIKSLHYKRFRGQHLKGDLLVKNEMAVSRKFSVRTMGGDLELSGILDAKNQKAIDIVTSAKLNNISVDSVFYVFQNFDQDFVQDKHLKGQASADVNMEMTLNEHLKLFPGTLIADISATIKNGQLNNFEPMKKLSRYLDDEGLTKLRFSDLKNDIHIEKQTIFIPQMSIRSNVTDILISGTHTFDQKIDYRLITPLRRKKVADPEAELATEVDQKGQTKLFLKITGTTDDYKISYDTESVRKKIASDFKKEVQELKDAFRSKGKKKEKEVELQKDEYFDW
jgi:hypothetical protein